MGFCRSKLSKLLILFVLFTFSVIASAKPEACKGVSEKCTKDTLYDKTIGGSVYSCYDCKQALCKDGGEGGLAGTKTSSVCTEKASTFTPITNDDVAHDAPTELAPQSGQTPASGIRPRSFTSELVVIPTQGCDARNTAMCSKNGATCDVIKAANGANTEVCRWSSTTSANACKRTGGIWTAANSKYAKSHPGAVVAGNAGACITEVKNISSKTPGKVANGDPHVLKTGKSPSTRESGLVPPSGLKVANVARTTLTLTWIDNSDQEYGVELYRVDPVEARRNPANSWEFIGLFEERVDANVKGTGTRSDEDYDLNPNTNYCYRLRAFIGFDRSKVSDYSETVCTKTKP